VASDETVGKAGSQHERVALEFTLTNAKPETVTFEVRQPTDRDGFKVVSEGARHFLKNGAAVWRVTLPANGTATVRYAFDVAA
jgi:hypothetical protein